MKEKSKAIIFAWMKKWAYIVLSMFLLVASGKTFSHEKPDVRVEVAGRGSSRILNTTAKQLQSKFKHATDFGLKGNWNKTAAGKFNSAINQHINSSGVRVINGTYRGQPAIHYLNPSTRLNVISTPQGQFWSGWRLTPTQLRNVVKHGGLK